MGGTKGNVVLEYVSGAPNKEFVVEDVPDVFDYDQLSKYGFSYLVTPIMNAGGRIKMYELMEMPVPPPRKKPEKVSAPPLVIDRTGGNDPGRYSGLKVTQIIDDEEMGRQLAATIEKKKLGKPLRSKIAEEDYVVPFAGTYIHPSIHYHSSIFVLAIFFTSNQSYQKKLMYSKFTFFSK